MARNRPSGFIAPGNWFGKLAATALPLCGLLLASPSTPAADEVTQEAALVNWYYSATFGTGFYKVGDATATVVMLPFAYELQKQTADQSGVTLLLPITIGAYNLNARQFDNFNVRDDIAAISFLPGVEWNTSVTEQWRLKPFIQLGLGSEFHANALATMYTGGVKSLCPLSQDADFPLRLGNALVVAGYRVKGGEEQGLGTFQTGIEMGTPWRLSLFDHSNRLFVYAIYYAYFSRLAFANPTPGELSVRQEGEVGFSFKTTPTASVLGFEMDTLGLGVRFANNLRGIRFVTEFPF
jgi:hypothetical protein